MNAPFKPDTATPAFTTEQAQAIADFCEAEATKRRAAARESMFSAECHHFADELTEIRFAALGVLDGEDGAELQRLMEELDYLPLWRAANSMRAAA